MPIVEALDLQVCQRQAQLQVLRRQMARLPLPVAVTVDHEGAQVELRLLLIWLEQHS